MDPTTENLIDGLVGFANRTYRLMFLLRYNIYPRTNEETVAAHVAQVSSLSLWLAEALEASNDEKLKILQMAVTHDLGEIVDVPHVLKNRYPSLDSILKGAETLEVKSLLPSEYAQIFDEYNKKKTFESIVVHIADVVACLIYAREELKQGNTYFKRVEEESVDRLFWLLNKLKKIRGDDCVSKRVNCGRDTECLFGNGESGDRDNRRESDTSQDD
jgi:5'-deoxynucleotidase YfbR-like HD superfamily hydrolase